MDDIHLVGGTQHSKVGTVALANQAGRPTEQPGGCRKVVTAARLAQGRWPMAHGPWPVALGPWPRAHGPGPMAHGPWPMAHGPGPMALGLWPMAKNFNILA